MNMLNNKTEIAGLKVDAVRKNELLSVLKQRIEQSQKTWVTTAYSEFLYAALKDKKVLEMLNKADICVADGIGIFWAKKYLEIPITAKSYWGKILQAFWQLKYSLAAIIFNPSWIKSALPEKIVGADLVWDLAKLAADNNFSVFLLGGFGNTPYQTAEKLKAYINDGRRFYKPLVIEASNKNPQDSSIIEAIKTKNSDILLVAYGPIKQERWISENLNSLNSKLIVGVGGSLDYIAGVKSSPPKFIRSSGFEWLWRLVTQPYRLARIFNATLGLAGLLWHYKVFSSMPLRQNVAVVIINKDREVLVGERNPKDIFIDIITTSDALAQKGYWQLPQGGLDAGENFEQAAKREATEETGLTNLELIKISEKNHTYIWNNAVRPFLKNKNKRNIGQTQKAAYFKFNGANDEVKIDGREFVSYRWVPIEQLENTIHKERMGLTKIVSDDLKEMLQKGII